MTQPRATVIFAAGQRYAVQFSPLDALKLADTARILKLHDGDATIYLRSQAITHASEIELPSHHGRVWNLKDAAKPGRPSK